MGPPRVYAGTPRSGCERLSSLGGQSEEKGVRFEDKGPLLHIGTRSAELWALRSRANSSETRAQSSECRGPILKVATPEV